VADLGSSGRVDNGAAAREQVRQAAGLHGAAVTGPARYEGELGAGLGSDGCGRRQSALDGGESFTDKQDGARLAECLANLLGSGEGSRLRARYGRDESRAELLEPGGEERSDGHDGGA